MGYLVLDHRACDPAIQRPYGGLKEFDTTHCQHGEHVIVKIPGKPRMRALCYSCGEICESCWQEMQRSGGCVKSSLHFRRKFDAARQRQQLFDAAGL